jgi:hypothetical protein
LPLTDKSPSRSNTLSFDVTFIGETGLVHRVAYVQEGTRWPRRPAAILVNR